MKWNDGLAASLRLCNAFVWGLRALQFSHKHTSAMELDSQLATALPEDARGDVDREAYRRITSEDLAAKLDDKTVLVIDCRGREFKGGHIPGCENMRAAAVLEQPEAVVDLC